MTRYGLEIGVNTHAQTKLNSSGRLVDNNNSSSNNNPAAAT